MQDFMGANEKQLMPMQIVPLWIEAAESFGDVEVTAVHLATQGLDDLPNLRVVYARGIDDKGVCFYTHYVGQKGRELETGQAAINFYFPRWQRQIRLRGVIEKLSNDQSDAYFLGRSEGSRLGAWVSKQSEPLVSREFMIEGWKSIDKKKAENRPSTWGGYRLRPLEIEFWVAGEHRLHDRFVHRRKNLGAPWQVLRLYP